MDRTTAHVVERMVENSPASARNGFDCYQSSAGIDESEVRESYRDDSERFGAEREESNMDARER